jgi:hypothetical protein
MVENKNQQEGCVQSGPKNEKLILVVIGVLLLGIIFGSGYWLWSKLKPEKSEKKVSIENLPVEIPLEQKKSEPEKTEEAKTEETPEVKIDLTAINVKVLNGGTTPGTATVIKNKLIAKGYQKTEAVNASASSYNDVAIYYKIDFKDQVQEIKDILSEMYKIIETKEGMNEKEVAGDIVIILGK